MRNVTVHFTALPFFTMSRMAAGQCHEAVPAIAAALPDSKIVTAMYKERNIKRRQFLHSWVERDGIVVDAAAKSMMEVKWHEDNYEITDRKERDLETYKKEMGHTNVLFSRDEIVNNPEFNHTFNVWSAYLYQRVQKLDAADEEKEMLETLLLVDADREAIIKFANKIPHKQLHKDFSKIVKKYKYSYLWGQPRKLIPEDTALFLRYDN
jgi:hypothetical protein